MEPIAPERAEGIWKAVESSLPELRPWMPWAPTADLASTRSFAPKIIDEVTVVAEES